MNVKKFTMIDEDFICDFCGKKVSKLGYTARDHCPFCLSSKHVDNYPGDRLCTCHGILKPIGVEKSKKDLYKIIYQCQICGAIKKNIQATDDSIDKLIDISVIDK